MASSRRRLQQAARPAERSRAPDMYFPGQMYLDFRQMPHFLDLAALEMPGQIRHDRSPLNLRPTRCHGHGERSQIHQLREKTHVHKGQLGTFHIQGILRRVDRPFPDKGLLDSYRLHTVDIDSGRRHSMGSNSKDAHMDNLQPAAAGDGLVGFGRLEQLPVAEAEQLGLALCDHCFDLLLPWHTETVAAELRSGGIEQLLLLVDRRNHYMISVVA